MKYQWDGPETSSTHKPALRPREIHLPGVSLDFLLVRSALSTLLVALHDNHDATWVLRVTVNLSFNRAVLLALLASDRHGEP